MLQWHHVRLPSSAELEDLIASANQDLFRLDNALNARFITTRTSGSYDVQVTDDLILADASAGPVTIQLPLSASSIGSAIRIKKTDATANAVTINAAGSDTIEGAASVSITTQYGLEALFPDGTTKWWRF